jgi:hypothetical protein
MASKSASHPPLAALENWENYWRSPLGLNKLKVSGYLTPFYDFST